LHICAASVISKLEAYGSNHRRVYASGAFPPISAIPIGMWLSELRPTPRQPVFIIVFKSQDI
jgi:hypothetical protein